MKKHNKSIIIGLKVLLLFLCFLALKSSSCKYDDTELRGNIANLENRVETLEDWKISVNVNIESLRTIVTSFETRNFIATIEPLYDNEGKEIGYKITFQTGDSITIKHGNDGVDGKDGKDGNDGYNGVDGVTPVIGVAQDTDGIYYWTVDGEFLTDNSGAKLPVTGPKGEQGEKGKDGADAITPKVRINETTNVWEISTDNGQTWREMKDANGDFINATGAQGPKGEKGDKGEKGEKGETGPKGDQGDKGDKGDSGDRGVAGAMGPKGERGDSMFKSIDYTSNPDVVYFILTATDNTGANIVLAVPRVPTISIAFADGVDTIDVFQGSVLTLKFTGLTFETYNALVAEIKPVNSDSETDIVTRANDRVTISKPVFTNGKCDSTNITLNMPAEIEGGEAFLRVTLLDNKGKQYIASRTVRLFTDISKAAKANGGAYTPKRDLTMSSKLEIAELNFKLNLNKKKLTTPAIEIQQDGSNISFSDGKLDAYIAINSSNSTLLIDGVDLTDNSLGVNIDCGDLGNNYKGNTIQIKNTNIKSGGDGIMLFTKNTLEVENSKIEHKRYGIFQDETNPGSTVKVSKTEITGKNEGISLTNKTGGDKYLLSVEESIIHSEEKCAVVVEKTDITVKKSTLSSAATPQIFNGQGWDSKGYGIVLGGHIGGGAFEGAIDIPAGNNTFNLAAGAGAIKVIRYDGTQGVQYE